VVEQGQAAIVMVLDVEPGQFRVWIQLEHLGVDDVLDAGQELERIGHPVEETGVGVHESAEKVLAEGSHQIRYRQTAAVRQGDHHGHHLIMRVGADRCVGTT
jgi:hypothetical protein